VAAKSRLGFRYNNGYRNISKSYDNGKEVTLPPVSAKPKHLGAAEVGKSLVFLSLFGYCSIKSATEG